MAGTNAVDFNHRQHGAQQCKNVADMRCRYLYDCRIWAAKNGRILLCYPRNYVKKPPSLISPSPPVPTASGNNAYMLYIFNRNGVCLLYREWNRPLKTLNSQQDHKLMFGLLFSLKSLTAKMDPTCVDKGNLGVPQLPGQGCSFHSFRTNTYKLSFMESPSGIKIILVTHPRTGDLRESLKYIYNLYVEYVVKNPLYSPGTPVRCELFDTTVDQYVRGLG
ncbi:unnamed protein product [Fraxinus pennsylvanica]|uniref:Trafficking protein particle complex subunit n=1 Tax=Fraxinus pennsylvanica TaxID=56036 RepID=A0AAD1Z8G3_9LAMI|nr:unnamed protein product [Fraxinus pennsylvanica]